MGVFEAEEEVVGLALVVLILSVVSFFHCGISKFNYSFKDIWSLVLVLPLQDILFDREFCSEQWHI